MEACRRSAGGSTKLMAKPFEVVFEAAEAVEGGYDARALGYSIFTQGDDWEHLKAMAKDAVLCHFGDDCAVRTIRLRLVKDEADEASDGNRSHRSRPKPASFLLS